MKDEQQTMYKNSGTGSKIEPKTESLDKRVDNLETKIRLLIEELGIVKESIRQASRATRRQGSDIDILSGAIRRTK